MPATNELEDARRLGPPINDANVGRRVDGYLAEFFPFFSRTGWQQEIRSGAVLVNEVATRKPAQRLLLGDRLSRISDISEEPDVDTTLEIIWKDEDFAAVAKPAGLPMHEGGRYHQNTFINILPNYLGPGWAHVHRLDRETSGLVLCARTPELRAKLANEWNHWSVAKTYLAITTSKPSVSQWSVDHPIRKERTHRTGRAELSDDGAKALTEFICMDTGDEAALIIAKPITGRNNQIRLHLQASGLRLVGEKMYGVDPEILETYRKEGNSLRVQEMAGFPRHALHCWKMAFRHPHSHRDMECVAPLPADLVALCQHKHIRLPRPHVHGRNFR